MPISSSSHWTPPFSRAFRPPWRCTMVSLRNRLGMLPLLALLRTPTKPSQHRAHDSLLRQADTLTARHIVRHSRRSFSRRGACAHRRCLPPPPTLECERACGWLWDATCWESGLCELGRQQPRRTCDTHQQRGGPDPDCARQVLGLRPRLGRGPHYGLWHLGKLSW
jgi:hypothetical protein